MEGKPIETHHFGPIQGVYIYNINMDELILKPNLHVQNSGLCHSHINPFNISPEMLKSMVNSMVNPKIPW